MDNMLPAFDENIYKRFIGRIKLYKIIRISIHLLFMVCCVILMDLDFSDSFIFYFISGYLLFYLFYKLAIPYYYVRCPGCKKYPMNLSQNHGRCNNCCVLLDTTIEVCARETGWRNIELEQQIQLRKNFQTQQRRFGVSVVVTLILYLSLLFSSIFMYSHLKDDSDTTNIVSLVYLIIAIPWTGSLFSYFIIQTEPKCPNCHKNPFRKIRLFQNEVCCVVCGAQITEGEVPKPLEPNTPTGIDVLA